MRTTILFLAAILFTGILTSQSFQQTQQLTPKGRSHVDWFGITASVSGSYAIVGAMRRDQDWDEKDNGIAYFFSKESGEWKETQAIMPSDTRAEQWFGRAVAIHGSVSVVGGSGVNENDTGSAYIFELDDAGVWIETKKLIPHDLAEGDYFGRSVVTNGEFVAVQASRNSYDSNGENYAPRAGAVYIFTKVEDQWTEVQKVVSSVRNQYDIFGDGLCISGEYLAIGSVGWYGSSKQVGSVDIFRNVDGTFLHESRIVSPVPRQDGQFALGSVSLSGDYLAVGSSRDDFDVNEENYITNSGSVFIYHKQGSDWVFHQKIVNPHRDLSESTYFGHRVSLVGSTLITSTPLEPYDGMGENHINASGAGFIYTLGSDGLFKLQQKIVPDERFDLGLVGESLAYDGSTVLMGSHTIETSDHGIDMDHAGAVYVFTLDQSILPVEDVALEEAEGLSIFPNPTSNIITITSDNIITQVELYSILGQKVKMITDNFSQIHLDDLSRGLYIARISTQNGTNKTMKIIKN